MGLSRSQVMMCGAAVELSMLVLCGCDQRAAPADFSTEVVSALISTTPGQTVVLDFKTDSLGNPLPRGTVLAEQYAALGIHFDNGFVLGDRAVDFPDYHSPAPDNLVCTYEGSLQHPNAISWTDGRCAGGPATAGVPFVMRLDFPACYVSVQGKGLPVDQFFQAGYVTIAGFDSLSVMKGLSTSRDIYNSFAPDSTGALHYSGEGAGLASIPTGTINPNPIFPRQGFDLRRVNITERNLAALDNITIIACHAVVPRCKNRRVCLNANDQCTSPADVSIDDGSYAWTGRPLTLAQSAGPISGAGPFGTLVTLTATDGSDVETCQGVVSMGDCDNAPALTCPAPVRTNCAPPSAGSDLAPKCTFVTQQATASDRCSSFSVSPSESCFRPGTTQVSFTTAGLASTQRTCSSSVTIVDTEPPSLGPPAGDQSRTYLNNIDDQFHMVTLNDCVSLVDACEGPIDIRTAAQITCVTSDEKADPDGDIQIVDAQTVMLRARRDPRGDGRWYRINFRAKDSSGNLLETECGVGVPVTPGGDVTIGTTVRERICREVSGAGGQGGGATAGCGGRCGVGGAGGAGGSGGGGTAASTGGGNGMPPMAGISGTDGTSAGTGGFSAAGGAAGSVALGGRGSGGGGGVDHGGSGGQGASSVGGARPATGGNSSATDGGSMDTDAGQTAGSGGTADAGHATGGHAGKNGSGGREGTHGGPGDGHGGTGSLRGCSYAGDGSTGRDCWAALAFAMLAARVRGRRSPFGTLVKRILRLRSMRTPLRGPLVATQTLPPQGQMEPDGTRQGP